MTRHFSLWICNKIVSFYLHCRQTHFSSINIVFTKRGFRVRIRVTKFAAMVTLVNKKSRHVAKNRVSSALSKSNKDRCFIISLHACARFPGKFSSLKNEKRRALRIFSRLWLRKLQYLILKWSKSSRSNPRQRISYWKPPTMMHWVLDTLSKAYRTSSAES